MAIYHLHIKMISKGDGRSATAAAAYRSGSVITDTLTQQTHDYTKKKEVVHSEVNLPAHAPRAYQDRATLWNAVEAIEKNKNAQLAREIELALPVEWSTDKQVDVMREFIQANFVDLGMCADWSIHDKGDGNPHCHIMLTTRQIKPDGSWAAKEKKVYKLDEAGNRIPVIDPQTGQQKITARGEKLWQRETKEANNWNDHSMALTWRKQWADTANKYLDPELQISHESYAKQGIEKEPTIHEGYAARAMEARGEEADRIRYNQEVKERNSLREQLKEIGHEIITTIKERLDNYVRYFQNGLEKLQEAMQPSYDYEDEPEVYVTDDMLRAAEEALEAQKAAENKPKEPTYPQEPEPAPMPAYQPNIEPEDDYKPKKRWSNIYTPYKNMTPEEVLDYFEYMGYESLELGSDKDGWYLEAWDTVNDTRGRHYGEMVYIISDLFEEEAYWISDLKKELELQNEQEQENEKDKGWEMTL